MHGILVLDKPRGPTCQQVLSRFRKAFPKTKVGYTGTLDPFATGALPIFIGAATKLIPYIPEDRKTYEALLKLGEETDTLDCEGMVIRRAEIPELSTDEIERVLKGFLGKRLQIPPKFSAVKIEGSPLYRWARKGIEKETPARGVEIFSLKLLDFKPPLIRFSTEVSRGTYVRSLASEIAGALGCVGHLTELRRLKSGPFDLERSVSLEGLSSKSLYQLYEINSKNISNLMNNFKAIRLINSHLADRILQGQTVRFETEDDFQAAEMPQEADQVFTLYQSEILSVSQWKFSKLDRKPTLKPLRIIQLPLS